MLEEIQRIFNNVPIYCTGGAVRDELLGKVPKDYDYCTPLLPEEIEQKIRDAGRRPYLTGKRFGTIGVKVDGKLVEITTFRREAYEPNSRKPKVEYVTSLEGDLSRRDFRMNAIAKRGNRYIDPFSGRMDILEKKIRCVGLPQHRFKEDPLRMLRLGRFAAQLEFDIDPFLESITGKKSYKILQVSKERWVMEMDKLLMTDKPSIGLDFLARTRLLNFMIPELSLQVNYDQNNPHHDFDLWTHTKKVVDNSPKDINLRWASLLHDVAKPFTRTDKKDRSNYIKHDYLGKEIVIKLAYYLKWSNQRREEVSKLVETHMIENSPLKETENKSKLEE